MVQRQELSAHSRQEDVRRFGTFGGVFTPSILTILGVIMFLRFAQVVGNAGFLYTLLILIAAKSITLITGLSISSISTNMKVQGGGAYYLISRSLGIKFGGVIAIIFYLAQAAAVTLYVIGFTEALTSAFPGIGISARVLSTITNIVIFASVYKGAGWTIRIQYGILAILMLSIASFFIGGALAFSPAILTENLSPRWSEGTGFFSMFALFFPAVTGIMAGVNMSGDLKDPGRSLPAGTLLSIACSACIYVVAALLLAAGVAREELLGPGFVMRDHALVPMLIYAGVFSATLSSALGSMMGAPRILQAFARDKIFPVLDWFSRGSGPSEEPRNAIVLTFIISQAGILLGDLNTVAPVITMCFLLTYGTVNLACFSEMRAKNPSFRPTFRMNHWSVSLFGAAGCLAVMFLISAAAAVAALLLSALLYYAIARVDLKVEWGDVESGLIYQRARDALLLLERKVYHPKNWRPSILVLSGGAFNRRHLADFACQFTAGNGMVSIAQVIRGRLEDLFEQRHEAEEVLHHFILQEQIPAFPVVVVEENMHTAISALVQCHGISGLKPNTVLLGWSQDEQKRDLYIKTLQLVKKMRRSLIIVSGGAKHRGAAGTNGMINIWWSDDEHDTLMVLLAFLLSKNPQWVNTTLRVIRTVGPSDDVPGVKHRMERLLSGARIDVDLVIVATDDPLTAVRRAMMPSAVLFVGFDPDTAAHAWLEQIMDLPGDILLVYHAGRASLQA